MLPLKDQLILDVEKSLRKIAKGKATVRVITKMPKTIPGTIRDENWRLK